jgi:hypothetical protein
MQDRDPDSDLMRNIIMFLVSAPLIAISMHYPIYSFGSISDVSSTTVNNNATSAPYNITAQSAGNGVSTFEKTDVIVLHNRTNGTVPYDALVEPEPQFIDSIIAESNGTISEPLIAQSGRNLYVSYSDDEAGKLDVVVSASRDFGKTFEAPINLSNNLTGNSTNPEIGAADDLAFIIFENDGVGNGDIFFGISSTAGQNWTIYNISNSTEASYDSTLSVNEEGEYFATWVERQQNGTVLLGYCGRWCW